MRILIVTPAQQGSRQGNRITALRWARLLRGLGHRVTLSAGYAAQRADLLLTLHAKHSYPAVRSFRALHPAAPVIVALTGTDLYRDLPRSRRALATLALADWLVALQPLAAARVPRAVRPKVRVILQSGRSFARRVPAGRGGGDFQVCVVGHLRREKDPFRAALAVRGLPAASRLTVRHAGRALQPSYESAARAEMARNPRYRWLGELDGAGVRRLMRQSRVMVHSSRMEGGANAVSEAILHGLPVLASRVAGNVGLLGAAYPGYYPVGDTAALRRLLLRAERDPKFLQRLERHVQRRAPAFHPARERDAWRRLIEEVAAKIHNAQSGASKRRVGKTAQRR